MRQETAIGFQSLGAPTAYKCETQNGTQKCYNEATYTEIGQAVDTDYGMWPNY